MSWETLAGAVGGVLALYALLLLLLWGYARRHPETVAMKDALRLLPDLVRLLRRLLADKSLGAGVRTRVALLVVYLLSPIDLVPDFLPVIGYADDVIIVALVLRSVVARAGVDAVRRHWPGTPAGLELVLRLAGLEARR
ncbi:YkvA family protein [Pseudarthrobacter sp. 1C304]|uniref:YkvA family protein n=1 Tax=Pseudarthrobacter sp. 1C304 TaxID=3457438 RepID=UPI003FD4DEC0